MSAAKPKALRRLFDLPLGARFRYAGKSKVYVFLSRANCGLIGEPVDDPDAYGRRKLQPLYAAGTRAEFEALMVEFVPVIEGDAIKQKSADVEELHAGLTYAVTLLDRVSRGEQPKPDQLAMALELFRLTLRETNQ